MNQKADTVEAAPYGAAKERLLRVLLEPRAEKRSSYQVAKDANVSYGWAHALLHEWAQEGMIKATRVVRPTRLFEEWAKMPQRAKTAEFQIQEPHTLFTKTTLDYAWTTYWAEKLVQQHLFPRRLDFYTSLQHWNRWRKQLANDGLMGGGNVRVILADHHVLETSYLVRERRVVSTPQLIVDLMREGGPCREAAELLITKEYHARRQAFLGGSLATLNQASKP
ncbi:MAG TPA: hypothetical protein VGB18_08490 [Candidatus Thermoplasmatota archaeon]